MRLIWRGAGGVGHGVFRLLFNDMKFILTLILIFVLVPPLLRLALRLFISKQVGKAQRQVFEQQRTAQRRTGTTNVDSAPPRKDSFRGGEYVDYEEVKD